MKYYILLFLSLLLSFNANGQITITVDDLVDVGDTVILADVSDVPENFDPGPPGPAQVWDFSDLVQDTKQELYFVDPAGTPYASSFPNSNMVVVGMMDSVYVYTIRNMFHYKIDGAGGSIQGINNVVAHFEPPEFLMNFPMNYLDSLEQTVTLDKTVASPEPAADSIRLKLVSHIDTKVDAWGSITSPVGTYDVLRIRQVRIEIDTVWVKVFGFWLYLESGTNDRLLYRYMANDIGYPVFETESDTAGNGYSVLYNLAVATSIHEFDEMSGLIIYPNPAGPVLNAKWNDKRSGTCYLIDIFGRQVLQQDFSHANEIRMQTSGISKGLYFYRMKFEGEDEFFVRKVHLK